MRIGEVQKRHAFAVSALIRSRCCRRSKSGDQNVPLNSRQTYRGGDDFSAESKSSSLALVHHLLAAICQPRAGFCQMESRLRI